jgi:hypothetical protein
MQMSRFGINSKETFKVIGVALACLVVIAFFSLLVFRGLWVTSVEKHEFAFAFNRFTGEIEAVGRTGYIVRTPIKYKVHAIDCRQYQLSITASFGSSGTAGIPARVLNAKLVCFNPDGFQTFVKWHGRNAGDRLSNLQEIMKCYAFDKEGGKDCPFITVISELNPSQTLLQSTALATEKQ